MNNAKSDFEAMDQAVNAMNGNKQNNDLSAYEEKSEFVVPDNIQYNISGEENYYDNQQENTQNSQFVEGQTQQYREPSPIDEFDEFLFPGGPLKSELESWKKQYEDVWLVDDLPVDQVFLYRDLTRYEYKAIMATLNTDALMREEMMCEQCVVFPYDYGYSEMSNGKAGIATVLASHIMETSGFSKASKPRRL